MSPTPLAQMQKGRLGPLRTTKSHLRAIKGIWEPLATALSPLWLSTLAEASPACHRRQNVDTVRVLLLLVLVLLFAASSLSPMSLYLSVCTEVLLQPAKQCLDSVPIYW